MAFNSGVQVFGAQPAVFGNQVAFTQPAMMNQTVQVPMYSGPGMPSACAYTAIPALQQSCMPLQSFPSLTQSMPMQLSMPQLMVAVPVPGLQTVPTAVQATAAPVQATAAPVQVVCAASMATAVSPTGSVIAPFPKPGHPKNNSAPRGAGAQRSPGDSRVIALVGVPITANVAQLERMTETVFGAQVLRSQALWNRATVLIEMDKEIYIQKRVSIGLPGVCALASSKGTVAVPKESTVLNVRFFLLHPQQDFKGTAEEKETYTQAETEWVQKLHVGEFRNDLLLGKKLEEASGETWTELATPLDVRRVAEVPGQQRRLYTQLYFAFQDEDSALEAAVASDGKIIEAMGLRMVVRSEYAKPGTIDPAPRTKNPNA